MLTEIYRLDYLNLKKKNKEFKVLIFVCLFILNIYLFLIKYVGVIILTVRALTIRYTLLKIFLVALYLEFETPFMIHPSNETHA